MSAIDVRLEALLAGDAPRDADEARRVALLDELRGATLRAPDALRARVLASAPAPRRTFVPRPSRRLVFVAVPAALGIAIAAALVHGLTGSGPQPVAVAQHTPGVVSGGAPSTFQTFTNAGSGGAVLAPTIDSPRAKAAPAVRTPGRLQHTDASLHPRVPASSHLPSAT